MKKTIGIKGTGCDRELSIMKETEKAYLLHDELNREYWLPKNCFDEMGELIEWGIKLLKEKITNLEYRQL